MTPQYLFMAFRAVEERVRQVANFTATDIGMPLMRRAFDANNGPLTKMTDPLAERGPSVISLPVP